MAINIKPSHRGLFTAKAKRAHRTVSQEIKAVLKPGSRASKETKKQAIFAKNARQWKKK